MDPEYVGFEDAVDTLEAMVDHAAATDEAFVITKDGEETAVLIGWSTWQQMRSLARAEGRPT